MVSSVIKSITLDDSIRGTYQIEPPQICIFVGPNNCGKSHILGEIIRQSNNPDGNRLSFNCITHEQAHAEFDWLCTNPPNADGRVTFGNGPGGVTTTRDHFISVVCADPPNPKDFIEYFLQFSSLSLNGEARLKLTNTQKLTSPEESTVSALQRIMWSDRLRGEFQNVIQNSFNLCPILSLLNPQNIELCLNKTRPPSIEFERSLSEEARSFQKEALPIARFGDGVRAFCGIILEVIAGRKRIIAIDEPEAFLHATLARRLGFELSNIARKRGVNLFISSHSSHFLMGCVDSGVPMNIYRMTRTTEIPTYSNLNSSDVALLLRDPLLRSASVMEGLFAKQVFVVEGDVDRSFYSEINSRLIRFGDTRAKNDAIFIHVGGKQNIYRAVGLLRRLGVRASAIVDFDIINLDGNAWTNLLRSLEIPDANANGLGQTRGQIFSFAKKHSDWKKRGINIFHGVDNVALKATKIFLRQARDFDLHIVPGGEVESWLRSLDVESGPYWLPRIFEAMGNDPESADYLRPAPGDIWDFVGAL